MKPSTKWKGNLLNGKKVAKRYHLIKKSAEDLSFPKKTCGCPAGTWKDAQHHESLGKCKSEPQREIASHLLEWLLSKGQEIAGVSADVKKREPCALSNRPLRVFTGAVTMETGVELSQKLRIEIPCDPAIPLLGIYAPKFENTYL